MVAQTGPDLKFRFLWLTIGYVLIALVITLSLISDPVDLGMNFPNQDKVYHAFAYFALMAWFSQIYHGRFQRIKIALALILMGVSLEYIQSFEPARYAEFADMLANTTGVVLGFLVSLTAVKNYLVKIEGMLG